MHPGHQHSYPAEQAVLVPPGLLSQMTKAALERGLAEELTGHLGYEKHDSAGRGSGNSRNGSTGNRADRCRRGGPGSAWADVLRPRKPDPAAHSPEPAGDVSHVSCRITERQGRAAERQGQGRRQADSGAAELGDKTLSRKPGRWNSNDVASSIEWPSS